MKTKTIYRGLNVLLCVLLFVPMLPTPATAATPSISLHTPVATSAAKVLPKMALSNLVQDLLDQPSQTGQLNIINCNFEANGAYGLNSSVDVQAFGNWWGDISGPTHVSNPRGQGDAVTDQVIFYPWRDTPQDIEISYLPYTPTLPGDLTITHNNIEEISATGYTA
ncbi:MAG: hypothetical protein JXR84_12855 [Anaerolineae bacterium]|nr:hypothetical protein [Anaerolineae bacterium]